MIATLLTLHFIADFVCQPREMGKKKSSDIRWLLGHLLIQFLFFFFGLSMFIDSNVAFRFAVLNCAVHGVIDWYIWRGYKYYAMKKIERHIYESEEWSGERWAGIPGPDYMAKRMEEEGAKWKYWEDHMFYTTIGFDQLLHGLTLVGLAKILL